jgi:putative hydrolase of the HAD superfamily
MIGNSLKRDIAGAQRAGVRAIWLDRSGTAQSKDVKPYARITSLGELMEEVG